MHVASSSGGPKVMTVATKAVMSVADDGPMQKRAGRTETGIRAGAGDVAPHPAQHDQMREESHGKPQPQRAGRPGKRAADTVDRVESNQRAAPDGEARREPP